MKLLSSLRWPFLVWQMVGTAPFTVAKKALVPVQNPKLQLYSAILFIVNVVLLILSMVFTSVYIAPTEKVVTWYNSLVTMLSIRLLTCIVVLEAILKVNRQTDLLQRITRVDFILRHKLRIHVDYKKHQFHNNLMTTVWVFGCFACIVSVFVVQHVGLKNKTEETFWLIYAIPFLMYSMNYHRMVSYVYEIRRRYQMLNCFLEDICTAQQRRSLNDDLLANGRIENLISKSQLIDFRNAYQILYEASNVVNDTFWWSLPLCIGIDFHLLLMNSYGVFAVLLLRGEVIILGVVVSWGSMNIAHLLLLSHACHSASKEVCVVVGKTVQSVVHTTILLNIFRHQ